ncbi:CDP-glucose 4,6-dehydratase [Synechococcus sp. W4D4]|uniref:CDP-glucose 4,6-dehydratase n=1 Tax=Synechococcus sp. W4D4 TaxID=3392294 RepID=UPI0039ED49FC
MTQSISSLYHPNDFWKGKRVLVTGHTGFKGSWLCLWLQRLGAEIYGYSLPASSDSLFTQLSPDSNQCQNYFADVRNAPRIDQCVAETKPDVIFHLAAQPLVLSSYQQPKETWDINVTGTINLLQATRNLQHTCAIVVVTTDKVYLNQETTYSYRETDPLGGIDPYSSSKAAAELAVASWRSSFTGSSVSGNPNLLIATARAGNVIGGGDWAPDRLIPDFVRAYCTGSVLTVRHPFATRPWQHVLDPLNGYIRLAEKLYSSSVFAQAFNFGPLPSGQRTVSELLHLASLDLPVPTKSIRSDNAPHEAKLLSLSIDHSAHLLEWLPYWDFEQSVRRTVRWYKSVLTNELSPADACLLDLSAYTSCHPTQVH